MRLRVPIAVVSLSTIAACSLFSGLEGFSGQGDAADASTADGTGGADGSVTPPSDSSTSDTTIPDGDSAIAIDAGGDGARFCDTQQTATLCEDFDDVNPLQDWMQTTEPGASFALVTDRFLSA